MLQPPGSYICWAAVAACVGNRFTGSKDNAIDAARWFFGDDYNHGAFAGSITHILTYKYKLSFYSTYSTTPSISTLYSNVNIGKPVPVRFSWVSGTSSDNHFVLTYGVENSSGNSYISIMDPGCGITSAKQDNTGSITYIYPGTSTVMRITTGYCA